MEFLEEIEINGGIIHCEDTLIIEGEPAIVSHIINNEDKITLCFTDGTYYDGVQYDGLNDNKLVGNELIEASWTPYMNQELKVGMKVKSYGRIRTIVEIGSDGIFYGHGDWTFDKIDEILTF